MATQNMMAADSIFFADSVTEREHDLRDDNRIGSIGSAEDIVKGMISYPCCLKETVMVYSNTHGQASAKCPRCGKYAIFDYDLMQARPSTPVRGASRIYKKI